MTRTLLVAALTILTTSTVSAQVNTFTVPTHHHHVSPVIPVPTYGVPYHSSTVYEGQQRGNAAVIEALGNAIEAQSRSNINNQVARQLQIANKKQEIETRLKLRELAQKKQAEQFAEDRLRRQVHRSRNYRVAPQETEQPTTAVQEVDLLTGEIQWPAALQDRTYVRSRQQMEELVQLWVVGDWSVDLAQKIDQTAEQLKQELKVNMRSMRTADYMAAKQFLENLARLGRTAPDA